LEFFGSLFYDAFSVTRLYSVDDRVTSEWWWVDEDKHPCLMRDSNPQSQHSSYQVLCPRLHGHWDQLQSWRWCSFVPLSALGCSRFLVIFPLLSPQEGAGVPFILHWWPLSHWICKLLCTKLSSLLYIDISVGSKSLFMRLMAALFKYIASCE
jgi:hypothetical protein